MVRFVSCDSNESYFPFPKFFDWSIYSISSETLLSFFCVVLVWSFFLFSKRQCIDYPSRWRCRRLLLVKYILLAMICPSKINSWRASYYPSWSFFISSDSLNYCIVQILGAWIFEIVLLYFIIGCFDLKDVFEQLLFDHICTFFDMEGRALNPDV